MTLEERKTCELEKGDYVQFSAPVGGTLFRPALQGEFGTIMYVVKFDDGSTTYRVFVPGGQSQLFLRSELILECRHNKRVY